MKSSKLSEGRDRRGEMGERPTFLAFFAVFSGLTFDAETKNAFSSSVEESCERVSWTAVVVLDLRMRPRG